MLFCILKDWSWQPALLKHILDVLDLSVGRLLRSSVQLLFALQWEYFRLCCFCQRAGHRVKFRLFFCLVLFCKRWIQGWNKTQINTLILGWVYSLLRTFLLLNRYVYIVFARSLKGDTTGTLSKWNSWQKVKYFIVLSLIILINLRIMSDISLL